MTKEIIKNSQMNKSKKNRNNKSMTEEERGSMIK